MSQHLTVIVTPFIIDIIQFKIQIKIADNQHCRDGIYNILYDTRGASLTTDDRGVFVWVSHKLCPTFIMVIKENIEDKPIGEPSQVKYYQSLYDQPC